MLKMKKSTASGKLVLITSVRRHWTSGGCPFSADRSGTETAQPQNEILCVLTQALLASIIPNQNNFGITTVLAIPHDGGSGRHRGTESL